MSERELLTVMQVAQWVNVEPAAVRHWLRTGNLKGLKLPGGDWRVRADDVEGMLKHPESNDAEPEIPAVEELRA